MRIHRNIFLLLFALSTIDCTGCTNLDSLVRSAEKTFGKVKPGAEVGTAILDEAGKAYQAGNLTQAEERYKEYIDANQRSGDKSSLAVAHSQLGKIAFDKNDFKASNRYFDEAIKLDPDNLEVRGLYGQNLYMQKEYHRAEPIFLQSLQIAPNDRRFQIMLGRTMAQQKQYQAGLRYLKQALGEQGAYEEMAKIYNSHSEFDKATLAMSKARESYNKQQQLAANFPSGGVSVPVLAGQQGTANQRMTQFPVAPQTQPYQPVQTAFPPQQQPTAMQQVARQQSTTVPQNVTPQQVSVQPYQYQYQHQNAAQQPPQFFPQQRQPVIIPNLQNSWQQDPPSQNYDANLGTMNSAAPTGQFPGQYPGVSMPSQRPLPPQPVFENNRQQPQDNRPPQGFAAAGQQPMATAPTAGSQTIPVPYQQNNREIAWHPNDSATQPGTIQPGPMQPGTMYPISQLPEISSPGMPSQINPLAERVVSSEQSPMPSAANPAMPVIGNWNNPPRSPVFSDYPLF